MGSMAMADVQLQAAICSGGSWWSDARAGGPHGVDDETVMLAPLYCSSPEHLSSGGSSTAGGQFNWPAASPGPLEETVCEPIRACDESPESYSTTTYQDIEYLGEAYGSMAMQQILEARSLQELDCDLSSLNCNWGRPFLPTTADETRINGLIQEGRYSWPYCPQELGQFHGIRSIYNPLDLLEYIPPMSTMADLCSVIFPESPLLLETSSLASSGHHHDQVDDSSQPPFTMAMQTKQRVQFSNATSVWNPCVSSAAEACSRLVHLSGPNQLVQNEINIKANSGAKNSSSTSLEEKDNSEPVLKKARIETPSPLPTFKVRKDKLGDRITLLQQLVSPFGKTDTASVLHEAIDYIKFLHDQVQVLISPQSKISGQKQEVAKIPNPDLRSRGLCLVPISSTLQMIARENPVDLWPLGYGVDPSY